MKASRYGVSRSTRWIALWMVLLVAEPMWLWAAKATPELPKPPQYGVSQQEQQQLGLQAKQEVYKQMPVLPDNSPETQYVRQIGARLQQVIPAQYNWPYEFHVVPEKDINAFALPGGPIFVNIGTITAASNEAQLAGVLAHEMSHVYMQHSIHGMQQNQKLGILSALGQILGQAIGGVGGALAQLGAQIGPGLVSMKYSRSDEAQADAVGAIILWKAGYDPKQMAIFFQTLQQQGGSSGPQFMSDHPNPGNRVQAVSNEVKDWPSKKYTVNTPQFNQVKQQARSVRAYTAEEIAQMAKTGQIHNTGSGVPTQQTPTMGNVSLQQVMPSGSFQDFNQGGISFQYPSNWQVMQDQQGGGLTVAPQAGVAQGAVAYGVVINSFQPQGANSLDQAMQQLVGGLQQSDPNIKVVGNPQQIRVNGMDAESVDLRGVSPIVRGNQRMAERDWAVGIPTPDGQTLLYLIFVAPEQDYPRLQGTYEQMLRTFHFSNQ